MFNPLNQNTNADGSPNTLGAANMQQADYYDNLAMQQKNQGLMEASNASSAFAANLRAQSVPGSSMFYHGFADPNTFIDHAIQHTGGGVRPVGPAGAASPANSDNGPMTGPFNENAPTAFSRPYGGSDAAPAVSISNPAPVGAQEVGDAYASQGPASSTFFPGPPPPADNGMISAPGFGNASGGIAPINLSNLGKGDQAMGTSFAPTGAAPVLSSGLSSNPVGAKPAAPQYADAQGNPVDKNGMLVPGQTSGMVHFNAPSQPMQTPVLGGAGNTLPMQTPGPAVSDPAAVGFQEVQNAQTNMRNPLTNGRQFNLYMSSGDASANGPADFQGGGISNSSNAQLDRNAQRWSPSSSEPQFSANPESMIPGYGQAGSSLSGLNAFTVPWGQ